MTVQAYLEQFQNMLAVIEHSGGSLGEHTGIEQAIANNRGRVYELMEEMEQALIKRDAQAQYLATTFILGADQSKYRRLIENLENDHLQGRNNYPTTVAAAYNLLTNWKQDPCNIMQIVGPTNDGVSFTNMDENNKDEEAIMLANNGKKKPAWSKAHITCNKCGIKGHYASKCEQEDDHPKRVIQC